MVTLVGPGGTEGTRIVGFDELFGWSDLGGSDSGSYTCNIRSTPGGPVSGIEVDAGGTSVRELITRLSTEQGPFRGVGPGAVSAATIRSPGSARPSALDEAGLQTAEADPYPGPFPAAFFPSGGSLQYCRPVSSDTDDVNKYEYLTATSGALEVTLSRSGAVLRDLTVTPSKTKVEVGEDVDFAVSGSTAGHGQVRYSWAFDDGDFDQDPQPSHAWDQEGDFRVGVDVNTADGSYGYAQVMVQVGPKKPPKHDDNNDPPPGGNGTGVIDDPDHGPNKGNGGQAGNDPDGDPDGLPGTNGDDGTGTGQPDRDQGDPAPEGAADGEVSGILLSSATTTTVPDTEPEAPTLSAPPARPAVEPQRDPLLYAALAVPLLLLAGALAEYRLAVASALTGAGRTLRRRKEKNA